MSSESGMRGRDVPKHCGWWCRGRQPTWAPPHVPGTATGAQHRPSEEQTSSHISLCITQVIAARMSSKGERLWDLFFVFKVLCEFLY